MNQVYVNFPNSPENTIKDLQVGRLDQQAPYYTAREAKTGAAVVEQLAGLFENDVWFL